MKKFTILFLLVLASMTVGMTPVLAQDGAEDCIVSFRIVGGELVESAATGNCEGQEISLNTGAGTTATPGAACVPRTYTVVSGDTLIGIANQHGITLQELLSYNGIQTNSLIRPNDQLVVSRCSVPFEGDVGVEVSGLIDSVNAENVLVADFAPFVNTVGNGSQMILAEPGVLLTHDATEAEIRASNGAIDRFNSLNQIVLNHPEETQTGCGEGRFVWAVGNTLTAEIEDVRIHLPGAVGENWFLLIRCRFSDEQPDADAGSEIVFTDYIPGFAQVMLMPKGAFVSEEAFLQAAEISTSTYSCGSESCSRLKVAFLDVNTDAFAVATYTRESGWQSVSSNVSGS